MNVLPTVGEVAGSIDHAILKPNMVKSDVDFELSKAARLNVFSVCVRPSDVEYAVNFLGELGSDVSVGTVIGFPHGVSTTRVKVFETIEAVRDGAVEVDVVANIGWLVDNRFDDAVFEIREVTDAARAAGAKVVKVIFENAYLTDEQIVAFTEALKFSGADFVKTSTGFASTGAVAEDVALMVQHSGGMEVKASGGVKDLDTYLMFKDLGVTRFGTSNADIILEDLVSRQETGVGTHKVGGSY